MANRAIMIDPETELEARVVDDAGVARLATDAKTHPATDALGVFGGDVRIDTWQPSQSVASNTFTTVYTRNGPLLFHSAVFQLQGDEFLFVLEVDSIPIWPANNTNGIDLDEVQGPFQLTDQDFPIREYKSRRYLLRPPVPILASASISVKLKWSGSGSRRMERGMTVWGAP